MDFGGRIAPAQAIVAAFARRDPDAFVAPMSEDIVMRPSAFITGIGEYRGREELRLGLIEMDRELSLAKRSVRVQDVAYFVDEEDETKVLTLARITIRRDNGEEFGTDIAYLATVEDGLVTEVDSWLDHEEGLSRLRAPIQVA